MRQSDYERKARARIARAEAEMNATILRAFDRLMRVLERELTEGRIRADRKRKKVIR
jgi:hypothetical protein